MEIALSVKSFSFYHSSQSIYISGKVLELNRLSDQSYDNSFLSVKKGSQLSLKFQGDRCEEIFSTLPFETIAIKSLKSEESKDKFGNSQTNFLIEKIIPLELLKHKQCEQFMANL